jgi:DNA polymerase epsilon subunit 3
VFQALDEIEFGFMRERVEAEFASPSPHLSLPLSVLTLTCLPRPEFNQIQTSKRTDYRKKVKAQKKGGAAGVDSSILAPDVSMMSIATQDGENGGGEGGSRVAKKARIDTAGGDESRMEVDGEGADETSDADTVPDEEADGDETEEAEEEEEEGGEDEREGDDVEASMREEDEALEEDSD